MQYQFQPFAEKMKAENLPGAAIHTFQNHFEKFIREETGLIGETDILPVGGLADVFSLTVGRQEKIGRRYLHKTVAIKLNGGLGTGMGMTGPKGLLKIKSDFPSLISWYPSASAWTLRSRLFS